MKLRYLVALFVLAVCITPIAALAQINAFPSYTEDFESSTGNWVASGTNNTWAWGSPTSSPYTPVASGSRCWKTNLSGSYNNSEQSFVTSPVFDFSCFATDPTLSFYLVYYMESGYDYMNIQTSTDGGATWTTLGSLTSGGSNWYNVNSSAIGNSWGGGVGPGGTQTWKLVSHVLTGLAGKSNVMIRFRFYSDSSVTYAGPAVDLIQIAVPGGATVPPPALVSPADGVVDQPLTVPLSWGTSTCANTYDLQMATDASFSSIVLNATGLTVNSVNVSGLALYTTYYWRVRSVRAGLPGNWSTGRNFRTIPPPPGAPTLSSPLDASTAQSVTPSLGWLATTYAASYRVQVSTSPTFATILLDQTQPGTTINASGLNNFTTYYWRVQASNVSGVGPWSATWSFRTIIGTPLLASPSTGSQGLAIPIVAQWNAVTGATSYDVQVAQDANFVNVITSVTATGTNTLVGAGLQNNSQFFWRARARNGATEVGNWSTIWNFSTIIGVPSLVSPLDGTIDLQPQTITVNWQAVVGQAVYRVQVATDMLFSNVILEKTNIATTSLLLTGLQSNQLYYWRVQASNPNTGVGSWQNPYTFSTIVGAVAGTSPANASKGIQFPVTLQWTSAGGKEIYQIEVATDANFTKKVVTEERVGSTNTTYGMNSGLKNYTMYYWHVRPVSLSGKDVAWSATQNFMTILAAPAPTSPANGAVNQKIATSLMWQAPAGAVNYTVRVYEDDAAQTLVYENTAVTGSSVVPTDLKPETKYMWTAQAVDADGYGSEWSPMWKFTTTTVLAAVPALDKPANDAKDVMADAKLEWKTAEYAQTYDVQVSTASNFSSTIVNLTGVSNVELPVAGLALGQRYFWRVRSVNAAGPSAWSETWSFVVAPLAPAMVSLSSPPNGAGNQEYTVALSWNDVTGAESYQVQVSETNMFATTVLDKSKLPVATAGVSGLKEKTAYYWRVRATNSVGDGAWSDVWTFTTKQAPSGVGEEILAAGATLNEIYPNPASGAVTLGFTLAKPAVATLTIVNNLGTTVATIGTGAFGEGVQTFSWNAANVPAGLYVARLQIGNSTVTRLLNVVK